MEEKFDAIEEEFEKISKMNSYLDLMWKAFYSHRFLNCLVAIFILKDKGKNFFSTREVAEVSGVSVVAVRQYFLDLSVWGFLKKIKRGIWEPSKELENFRGFVKEMFELEKNGEYYDREKKIEICSKWETIFEEKIKGNVNVQQE